jgi:hypothetical protein
MKQALTILLVATMALTGCTTVDVFNISESSARVRITLPDTPAGYTRYIRGGDVTSTFSQYGGTVTVTVLPDQQYRELLTDLAKLISDRLWVERETLSADDVSRLVSRLQDVNQELERQAQVGASCSVRVSDFGSVTATVSWDSGLSNYMVSCSARE